jgi:ketosteroid isomerase-like protein
MPTELNPTGATKTFEQFVAAINSHDVEALVSLMTGDHLFVDSQWNQTEGAESMRTGWRGYFAICPDYWIAVKHILSASGIVLATGEAGGKIDATEWRIPAAWQAMIRDGKIAEWHVFADNKPVCEILARRAG